MKCYVYFYCYFTSLMSFILNATRAPLLFFPSKGNPHRWLDGSQVNYTYWANGQPDDSSGNERCVVMLHSDGKWADVTCTELKGYVCKFTPLRFVNDQLIFEANAYVNQRLIEPNYFN